MNRCLCALSVFTGKGTPAPQVYRDETQAFEAEAAEAVDARSAASAEAPPARAGADDEGVRRARH